MVKSVIQDLEKMMEFPKEGFLVRFWSRLIFPIIRFSAWQKERICPSIPQPVRPRLRFLKGKGTFVLRRKKIKMKPGVFIFMPKNAPHSLNADEDLAILLSLSGKG